MSRRPSRPSSAASYSSRTSNHSDVELKMECRAVFLGQYEDIRDEIQSKGELRTLLQQTGRNVSQRGIQKFWSQNTESLAFDDFVDICRREPVTTEDDLMKAFRRIDTNGDGYISLDELYKIMTSGGEKMSRSEVKAILDEVDENRDGKLDYREFSKMVVSTTEDFRKMTVKVMEKKERKLRKRESDSGSHTPRKDERPSTRDRERQETRPRSSGKGRSQQPSNLSEWTGVSSKGTFFLDDDNGIVSHVYSLTLTEDSDVWITIAPLKIAESGESLDGTLIDTALFVTNEDDNSFVAFTENRDSKGRYSLRCSLSMGTYTLIPFSTGCRLKPRRNLSSKEAKLVTKDRENKVVITRAFRKALEEIFEMADLDNNGLLSREEFNWYNMRTSGEEVADDEWQVVEDNIELDRRQIPTKGFIKLNEMEAVDNEGDTDDLWITLDGMGFSRSLILDEACPFMLKVYTQHCQDPDLIVTGLESSKDKITEVVADFVSRKGQSNKVRGSKDVLLHTFQNDHRGFVVLENKGRSRCNVELDCSRSPGAVSHTGDLVATVAVGGQTKAVGHYLLPLEDGREFNVVCEESILK